MGLVEGLGWSALIFWALILLDRPRRWPRECQLSLAETDAPQPRDVAVLIPARNEAEGIARCLPTILCQGSDVAAVWIIDDGSEDETVARVRDVLEGWSAVDATLMAAGPRPEGWSGKLHALEQGVQATRSRSDVSYLLFTDADIAHPPGSIRALRRQAEGGFDLVSVMVRLRTESRWERLLMPPFVYFFQMLYPFRRVSRPRSRVAAAAGGCVLISRATLESMGGLESVRGAIIDDVTLARRAKSTGARVWLGLSPDLESRRGYDTFGEISSMVARTAFTQLRYSVTLLLLCTVILLGWFVAPPFLLAAAVLMGQPMLALAGGGAWLLQVFSFGPAVIHQRAPRSYALLLPLASACYLFMTWVSAWRHWRGYGVAWRGRTVETTKVGS